MKKIVALHQFIVGLNVVAAKEVDSYVDKLVVTPSGRGDLDNPGSVVIADCKYSATYYISGYPFNRIPVEFLSAQIAVWLLEYDDERHETSQFDIIVDVFDEQGNIADVANLEFEIMFDESMLMMPDAGGNIVYLGKTYSLA